MRVAYTLTALSEVEEVFSHIARENPGAARRVLSVFEQVVARLSEFPQSGVETDMAGVRMTPILPFPYLIFYSIDRETLVVRNFRHGARHRDDIERS